MASLRQKKKGGTWFLDYRDIDGTRYRLNTGTKDKKVATLWLKKVEDLTAQVRLGVIEKIGGINADVVAGKKTVNASPLLSEYKDHYAERCRYDLELSEGSIELAGLAFDAFIRTIGDRKIGQIKEEDVIKWKRAMMGENKSRNTLSIYHRQLRAAFNRAIKWRLIKTNAFAQVEVSKPVKKKPGQKDMTLDEVKKLMAAIDKTEEHQFALYLRFMLYTGCRRNEILHLRWEDIDMDKKALKIHQGKTGRYLIIPINQTLEKVLQNITLQAQGYIFQSNSGSRGAKFKEKAWHESYVTRRFKKLVIDTQLSPQYSLHSLRHTYATHLRKKGVPLDIVQKLLGHASPRTTADNYDHSIAMHFKDQADLIDFE